MPSKKIFIYVILSIAVITSVWLLTRKVDTAEQALAQIKANAVVAEVAQPIKSNEDWKKILTSVSTSTRTVVNLTKTSVSDPTSLTAQMSKDFMSQYLLLKKGGRAVSLEEAQQIAANVLSVPEYTNSTGAIYVPSNLHITQKTDKETIITYKTTVNYILKNRSLQIKENPVTIVASAVKSESTTEIAKLDPIILTAKAMITELLSVEVPSDAVKTHLELINSISSLEANIEAMRESLNDPVKAMSGISSYNQNLFNFTTALKNINLYFMTKTGSL